MTTHKISPRLLGALVLSALTAATLPAAASAQAYPNKPVRWVVPFPPGGAMDNIARTLAESMGGALGQSFVVENRPGAGGNIGAYSVARSPADGYTIMIVANGMAVNPFLYKNMNYDPIADFAPISLLAVVPNVLVTNPKRNDARTVEQVIAKVRDLAQTVGANPEVTEQVYRAMIAAFIQQELADHAALATNQAT